uniref:Uncharacterized protein n=1 Tax=Solanum lycopersicum TaxID=4081 RepID=A0A3Q7EFK5_SOLLC
MARSKMDPTIHTVASSEMILTPSIAADPNASVAAESPMEVIARLERQISTLNLLVAQYQSASPNQPSDARERGPVPPVYPTSSEFHQGDHFATFQQTQSASLANLTQDIPLVYTFAPPKAPTVTHHTPPVYTYVTTPPVTKAPEFHRPEVNHYIEIEGDRKSIDAEMMNKKMKSLDAMRGLRGFDSSQSMSPSPSKFVLGSKSDDSPPQSVRVWYELQFTPYPPENLKSQLVPHRFPLNFNPEFSYLIPCICFIKLRDDLIRRLPEQWLEKVFLCL